MLLLIYSEIVIVSFLNGFYQAKILRLSKYKIFENLICDLFNDSRSWLIAITEQLNTFIDQCAINEPRVFFLWIPKWPDLRDYIINLRRSTLSAFHRSQNICCRGNFLLLRYCFFFNTKFDYHWIIKFSIHI